jgi:hypothetical protein
MPVADGYELAQGVLLRDLYLHAANGTTSGTVHAVGDGLPGVIESARAEPIVESARAEPIVESARAEPDVESARAEPDAAQTGIGSPEGGATVGIAKATHAASAGGAAAAAARDGTASSPRLPAWSKRVLAGSNVDDISLFLGFTRPELLREILSLPMESRYTSCRDPNSVLFALQSSDRPYVCASLLRQRLLHRRVAALRAARHRAAARFAPSLVRPAPLL